MAKCSLLLLLLSSIWVRQVLGSSVATLQEFVNSPLISSSDIEALLQSYQRTKEASRRISHGGLDGREGGNAGMNHWNSWFTSEFDLFVRCGFCTETQASYCCRAAIDKYCCKGPIFCETDACADRIEREIAAEKCKSGRACYRRFTLPKICCLSDNSLENSDEQSLNGKESASNTSSEEQFSNRTDDAVDLSEGQTESDCSTGLCATSSTLAVPTSSFDEALTSLSSTNPITESVSEQLTSEETVSSSDSSTVLDFETASESSTTIEFPVSEALSADTTWQAHDSETPIEETTMADTTEVSTTVLDRTVSEIASTIIAPKIEVQSTTDLDDSVFHPVFVR